VTLLQYFRIVWVRWRLVLGLFIGLSAAGIALTLWQPQQYTAETSLIVEVRIDPALGAMAPALAAPSYMATQVEIMRSERVASRAVAILGVERSPTAVAQWREATKQKIPLERYFASVLERGLTVDPSPGSNVMNLTFSSQDPIFAQAAANAFAQAYMDVSVELRVAPARQSATFLEDQSKTLRANLEQAQSRLSKFQQDKGIVASDERVDQEDARYSALVAQLAMAQAERVETSARQRNSGRETSPDVLLSPGVQGLKAQLAVAQTKLTEVSSIIGKNHPTRKQLEAQIAELQQQLRAETARVAGAAYVSNRGNEQRVAELQAMADAQKMRLLSLRSDHDQIAVYLRDVEAAQRAYDAVAQRLGQLNLEGQNNQANTRLLSAAVEPLEPSKSKTLKGIVASLLGALVVGIAAALGLEMLDRRVRSIDDLVLMSSVPLIGVMRPAGSRQPVFRKLVVAPPRYPPRPALTLTGIRP
jgi:chain length determinant protein EpsF